MKQLVEDRLGVPLDRFLTNAKAMGWSVRETAEAIEELTNVTVSKSSAWNWLRDVRGSK